MARCASKRRRPAILTGLRLPQIACSEPTLALIRRLQLYGRSRIPLRGGSPVQHPGAWLEDDALRACVTDALLELREEGLSADGPNVLEASRGRRSCSSPLRRRLEVF